MKSASYLCHGERERERLRAFVCRPGLAWPGLAWLGLARRGVALTPDVSSSHRMQNSCRGRKLHLFAP